MTNTIEHDNIISYHYSIYSVYSIRMIISMINKSNDTVGPKPQKEMLE